MYRSDQVLLVAERQIQDLYERVAKTDDPALLEELHQRIDTLMTWVAETPAMTVAGAEIKAQRAFNPFMGPAEPKLLRDLEDTLHRVH